MATDLDRSAELRDEEMLVLESLLDIQEYQKMDSNSGVIEIFIVFEGGVELVIAESLAVLEALQESMRPGNSQKDSDGPLDKSLPANHAVIHHLPPIRIKFTLPEQYPLYQPATVSVSACWIPRRIAQSIEVHAKKIWEENGHQAVLYELFQYITDRATSGDFFPFATPCLPIFPHDVVSAANCSLLMDSHHLLVVSHPAKLFRSMVHFDENRVVVVFQQQQHRCPVCFESFLGTEFTRLTNCRHWVCKECMKSLCDSLIKEGSLHKLQCMECQEELNPFDIQLSVEPPVWEKYQQFQLDNALSSMQDIVYCPRSWCNHAVIREADCDAGRCPGCSYVFCVHCRRGYHGVDPCAYNGDKKILADEYEGADSKTKQNMEQRYGRTRLRNLCDEIKAEEWVSKNAKQCPKCNFPVEKMGGCNKMVCSKCGSAFCWICMHRLTGVNPYAHFQDPQNKNCFMNLMMGIEDSDEEGGEEDGDDFDEEAFAAMRDDGLFVLEELQNVLGQAARMLQNI